MLKIATTLFCFVLGGLQLAHSQTKTIDSLKALLETRSGADRFDLYYDLTFEFLAQQNYQQAFDYVEEAERSASNLGDSLKLVKAMRVKAQILRRLDEPLRAIEYFQHALPIALRNNFINEIKYIYNGLALAFTFQAEYDQALAYHFKSLDIREKEGDDVAISVTLNNIGLVYFKLRNYEKALEYYAKALVLKERSGASDFKDQLLINMGLCYNQLNDFKTAQEHINQGLTLCGPECKGETLLTAQFGLGVSLFGMKEYTDAVSYFEKSYELAVSNNDVRFQAENMVYLAKIGIKTEHEAETREYLEKAEKLASAREYNELLIDIYRQYSLLFTQTKDYVNAANYQSRYIQLKDSVYSEELIKNLAKIQTDYEERENIKTIAEKNENIRLKEEIIVRQRQVYFFIAALAVLSLGLAFVFFMYNRAISKAKAEVTMLNQTLELKVQDRTKALQSVNNELDNFIYKTSHDIRGPLASLKGIANVALLELDDPKAKDYLRKLDNSADKLNSILTRLLIVNQINHAVLSPQKIEFDELISEILVFERKKGIPSTMKIEHEVEPGSDLVTDRHLLRIVLENLVDNAIKYHNNSERIEPFVKIKVSKAGDHVTIRVIDNGIGIQERDPQKLFQMFVRASERSESGGIGLYLTKLASERLEAKVDFATTGDKFTQFSVQLPADLRKVLEAKDMIPRTA